MKRYEMAIEVGPIESAVVAQLKSQGYAVYQGQPTWRVEVTADVLGPNSVRAQAEHLAQDIIASYGLTAVGAEPVVALRDPDSMDSFRGNYLVATEQAAYDRPPLARPRRPWWKRAMELGLGERKGD